MPVTFDLRVPPGEKKAVEYVAIEGSNSGADVIHRPATKWDREKYAAEYEEFKKKRKEEGKDAVVDQDQDPEEVSALARAAGEEDAEILDEDGEPVEDDEAEDDAEDDADADTAADAGQATARKTARKKTATKATRKTATKRGA